MTIVASSNGRVGLPAGMAVLRAGGSALDAVEAAIRLVESNPDDHTVGLGGLPNLLGVVELDASLMDGRTRRAGAVAGVRGYEHPISLARRVMDELPHVLLVGDGAERFARECGFPEADLLTDAAREIYEAGMRGERAGWAGRSTVLGALAGRLAEAPDRASGRDAGTVNVIAVDAYGDLACGVSTSGFAWKYPGRVGDSAVIGAGNYCDNRYGAAACTGRGELAIRAGTARSVIAYVAGGMTADEAGARAMADLSDLVDPYFSALHLVMLTPDGRPLAFSSDPAATFVWMREDSAEVEEGLRTHVPVDAGPAAPGRA